jgi:hypothetical protein
LLRPVIAQSANAICQIRIIGRYRASITESSQVFCWVKAESGSVPQRASAPALVTGTLSLRGVFNDF